MAQLPGFPPLVSRADAIQPVPASVGRLVQRNVLEIEPLRTPPPPIARLPDGQSCCWLFGLLLLGRLGLTPYGVAVVGEYWRLLSAACLLIGRRLA